MAEFDVDSFLKKKKSQEFDIDEFLAKTAPLPSAQSVVGGTESFARKIASRAAVADTALNAVTGLFDLAARVPATAYEYATGPGGFNEAYERASKSVGQAIAPDFFGRNLGLTKSPEYSQMPQRQLGEYVGQKIGENVITPVSEATGVHPGAVSDILNIGSMAVAPAVPKVAKPAIDVAKQAGQAAKTVVTTPINVGKGFYQGIKGIEPGSEKSALVPLRENYYPPEAVQAYMRGEIDLPTLQASQRPSSSLFATTEQKNALRMAERMPGEDNVPLIPVQGKSAQAFGERVGREYVTDPVRAAADVGLSVVAGVPLPLSAAQRAVQARQSRILSQAAQFDPAFRQKLLQDMNQPTPSSMQAPVAGPVRPQLGYNPNPIIPAGTQPRTVNIEGESFNLPYEIDTSQVSTARAPQTSTPVPDLAQLAAQRSAVEAAKSMNQAQQAAAQQVAGPIAPPPMPQAMPDAPAQPRKTMVQMLAELREKGGQFTPELTQKQMEKQQRQDLAMAEKQTAQDIISSHVKGGNVQGYQTVVLDPGKAAYNESNATKGMVQTLLKNGIDEIPVIQGMTEGQVINALFKELMSSRQATPKKKAPSNVSQMLSADIQSSLIKDKRFDVGTYDNPISHKEAMYTYTLAGYAQPERLNIVGKSANNSEKYIIRNTPGRNETFYEYTNPKTGKIELEIEKHQYKGGVREGSSTTIRDIPKDIVYKFENGELASVQILAEGKTIFPSMPEFSKYKIDYIDPMDAIQKIKK